MRQWRPRRHPVVAKRRNELHVQEPRLLSDAQSAYHTEARHCEVVFGKTEWLRTTVHTKA